VAETATILETREVTTDTMEYASQEIETFCKRRAIQQTIMNGQKFIDDEDWGGIESQIREAVTISLHRDLGLDYFKDPVGRLKNMLDNNQPISTGWANVDYILPGGLNRREILIMAAESGGGKSMTMLNLARNMVENGYNGIYYSLELAEDVVAKRTDSMMSNISQRDILKKIDQVATSIQMKKGSMGEFHIKQFPASTTTSMTIRSHLAEFELSNGWIPDFIVVDYLDLMSPSVKISMDNLFVKDKYVSEELRSLAVEFNCVMITASQLNRCLDPNTMLERQNGPIPLNDINIGDQIRGRTGLVEVLGKEKTKGKAYRVKTKSGKEFIISSNHRSPAKADDSIELRSIETGLQIGHEIWTDSDK